MLIKENTNLKQLNSFGIGVYADTLVELLSNDDFAEFYKCIQNFPKPFYILGGGNNTLFTRDFEGTIVKISNKGIAVTEENAGELVLECNAGEDWNDVVNFTTTRGLYGLENLIDIPGQAGSAPIQNIGAYGAEVKDTIDSVKFLDLETGEFKEFDNKECEFEYRSSIFKRKYKNKVIITSVKFRLQKNGRLKTDYGIINERLVKKGLKNPAPADIAKVISEIRAEKQPDPVITGNAGSFFKNPVVPKSHRDRLLKKYPDLVSYKVSEDRYKLAAGWMIDKAPFKGFSKGNAGVHSRQALVLINKTGKARGKEITGLARLIIDKTVSLFDVELEPEVNIL